MKRKGWRGVAAGCSVVVDASGKGKWGKGRARLRASAERGSGRSSASITRIHGSGSAHELQASSVIRGE
jgi:hypothetical protein